MSQKMYVDYNEDERKDVTRGVMSFLDGWKLSSEQAFAVLGLQNVAKVRHVQSYRTGERAFPDGPDLMNRLDHIIGIADALRTTFPFSDSMRLRWMNKPHRRFKKNTPMSVILSDDNTSNGLLKVRMEVDCAYGYAISEAMRAQSS